MEAKKSHENPKKFSFIGLNSYKGECSASLWSCNCLPKLMTDANSEQFNLNGKKPSCP